jgi:hypothetical protein
MKHEKIGTHAPENVRPGMLGGTPDYIAENGQNCNLKAALNATKGSGIQILKDREFGHLLGHPVVVVDQRPGVTFVLLRTLLKEFQNGRQVSVLGRRPRGWPNLDKEFLSLTGKGIAARKYADGVLRLIHDAGEREHQRREREVRLRLAARAVSQ